MNPTASWGSFVSPQARSRGHHATAIKAGETGRPSVLRLSCFAKQRNLKRLDPRFLAELEGVGGRNRRIAYWHPPQKITSSRLLIFSTQVGLPSVAMVVVGGNKEGGRWGSRGERMLMREISPANEDDWETGTPSLRPQQKLVVGYGLTSKKIKSFLQPRLEGLARKKGISFVAIDQSRPLSDQGPFDIVLHKLSGKEWYRTLEDYQESHRDVIVLDPPHAIRHLHNRQTMLQEVADLNLVDFYGKVGVPKQLVVAQDPSSIPEAVSKAGLILPIVAKPLLVDGTAKSHELSIAYDPISLSLLEPPLILQEFVNHGGIVFKVYVVGEAVKVLRRFSLPDVTEQELASSSGVYQFPRVSCAAASAEFADLDPAVAEPPPRPLLERLARELRRRLGLRLFNMDIIRDRGSKDRYFVIDINYFPGYGKLPGYEQIFTDFLLGVGQTKYKRRISISN